MARFFFDLADAQGMFPDAEGYEAADLAAARRMGRQALHESMRDNIDDESEHFELRMTILDADRLPVWVLVVTVSSGRPLRQN